MLEMIDEVAKFMGMSDDRFDVYVNRILKEESVEIDRHYIYHTAWAARILSEMLPEKHVDISSSIHFNTLVSAFVPIDFYDYRPAELAMSGLVAGFADVTQLPFEDDSIPSLSCMHVVEHIGLGRYGDEIDPQSDLKAISELKRVLSGELLFVVPVGKPVVVFNLHRIYSYEQIVTSFSGLELIDFSLLTDSGDFVDGTKELSDQQNYGCGCFRFRKGLK